VSHVLTALTTIYFSSGARKYSQIPVRLSMHKPGSLIANHSTQARRDDMAEARIRSRSMLTSRRNWENAWRAAPSCRGIPTPWQPRRRRSIALNNPREASDDR
jgi:hypothetical protein